MMFAIVRISQLTQLPVADNTGARNRRPCFDRRSPHNPVLGEAPMPFNITLNAAQYGGADWSNFIKTMPNCTPQLAQRVAWADPNIGFFFFCRQGMVLSGHPPFNPGDAVFFSGSPWPGSAPQADLYQKDVFLMAYVGVNNDSLANVGCYTLEDGRQLFDFAAIFAANINADENGNPVLFFNPQVNQVLNNTNDVKTLQDLGISVVLSVLNNWAPVGWSEFTSQATAQKFVAQLQGAVEQYGLDGIDIDDEYSTGTPNDTSLAMVTTLMRQTMTATIVSKALWSDSQYFGPTWNGHGLAGNLVYGWEMSYGDQDYSGRLQPYVDAGMTKNELAIGVKTDGNDGAAAAKFVRQNGYGGVMVFTVSNSSGTYLSTVSQALYSQNTMVKTNCLT
jgi:hypothetical protein